MSANSPDWTAMREHELGRFSLTQLPTTLKLPALPSAVSWFLQKAEQPDVNAAELARIIETDSGLTVELLRFVNSSFVALRNKAGSVRQAIALLGLRRCKTFVMTAGLQAAVEAKKSKLVNQKNFWNQSLQRGLFAREVAELLKLSPEDCDLAFAAGTLQDFLLPVLTNELTPIYVEYLGAARDAKSGMILYERSKFGWDHSIAAASLAVKWHFPDDLVCCIMFHHNSLRPLADPVLKRTAVAAVAVAALLPDQLDQVHGGLDVLIQLDQRWSQFDLIEMSKLVDEKMAAMSGTECDYPLMRKCESALAAV